MSLEREHDCPVCEESQTFYRAASTELHLGTKIKWHCPDCDYGFVTIGDEIDSSATV
jgi:ribosomal protein L37AE/L43A